MRDPDTSKMVHGWMKVNEANGAGQKQWSFIAYFGGRRVGEITDPRI